MILKNNVFVTQIQLDNGTEMEFVDKAWYALNIHKVYPDEKIGIDAFLDWARDLTWIKENRIIIIVKGLVNSETMETIEFLNEFWEKEFYELDGDPEHEKKVDFIIIEN